MCLGAQTDQLPTSTFWTVSGGLVSGLLTQPRRSCGEAHDLTLRMRHAVSVGSVRCARRLSPCACPKVRYKSMRAHAASDLLACARQTCSVSRSDKLPVGPHLRTPVTTSLPDGQAQRSIQIDGLPYVCHAFCSKVQATSTDLLFGAGGAPGRLRYDRVSTWCSLAGLGLGLLGSRAPGTTYNVSRAALIEALQRLASDEGEEPEARQHGYGQLDTRPQHPDRSWSSRRLSGGSGTSKSLT